MTRITIDASTAEKLRGNGDLIEICDESGKTVGHFYRMSEPPRDEQGRLYCPLSDEEIEERSKQETGRPLKDILADLSKL